MKRTKYLSYSFLLLFLFSNTSLMAIIVPSGSTLTLSNVAVIQDIIVEGGGTLVINGVLIMGSPSTGPHEIRIKDGGRMTSQGGSVSGYSPGKFTGIIVEGTSFAGGNTNPALELNNFSISDATIAINISGDGGINQNIHLRNTDFFDCEDLIKTNNTGAFNRDNSYNPVTFQNCSFAYSGAGNSGDWPIHMHFMNNVTFSYCTFDISGALNLHFNMQRNCTIIGCEFINLDAIVGMVFHRDNYNIVIQDNRFYGPGSFSSYVAVGVGVEVFYGIFHSGEISNNVFNNCGAGISIGDAANVLGGNEGDVEGVEIFGNVFNQNRYGIQCSKSSDVLIEGNDFYSCRVGLIFNGEDNVDPSVICNTFNSCRHGIQIDDSTLSQFNDFGPGIDLHNRFFSCLGDIYNNNGGMFIYNLRQWPYPGIATTTPNVSIGLGPLLYDCSGWFFNGGASDRSQLTLEDNQLNELDVQNINVNPNPSIDGIFKVQVTSNFEKSRIQLFNTLGQQIIVDRIISNNEVTRLDFSALPKGIYFLNVKTDKMIKTQQIVIQ